MEVRLREWHDAGEEPHAPELQRYEVANALARAVVAGSLGAHDAGLAWEHITAVPIALHRLEEGPAVVAMTQRLNVRAPTTPLTWCSPIGSVPSSGRSMVHSLATQRRAV